MNIPDYGAELNPCVGRHGREGRLEEADAAEMLLIEQMRRMVKDVEAWATGKLSRPQTVLDMRAGYGAGVKKTPVA